MSVSIPVIIYTSIQCLDPPKPQCCNALLSYGVESKWNALSVTEEVSDSHQGHRSILILTLGYCKNLAEIFFWKLLAFVSLWFMFLKRKQTITFMRQAFSIGTIVCFKLYFCIDFASLPFCGMLPKVCFSCFCCICVCTNKLSYIHFIQITTNGVCFISK